MSMGSTSISDGSHSPWHGRAAAGIQVWLLSKPFGQSFSGPWLRLRVRASACASSDSTGSRLGWCQASCQASPGKAWRRLPHAIPSSTLHGGPEHHPPLAAWHFSTQFSRQSHNSMSPSKRFKNKSKTKLSVTILVSIKAENSGLSYHEKFFQKKN